MNPEIRLTALEESMAKLQKDIEELKKSQAVLHTSIASLAMVCEVFTNILEDQERSLDTLKTMVPQKVVS